MEYPERANAKISLETKKQFDQIKNENPKISYREAIEFYVYSHLNPNSASGLELKKFLHEKKIKELESEIISLNEELEKEKREYDKTLANISNLKSNFDINNYNNKTIDIAKNYLKDNNITNIKNIDNETLELKLKTSGLPKNEFKNLLNYLIEKNEFKESEISNTLFSEIKEKLLYNDKLDFSTDMISLISVDIGKFLKSRYNNINIYFDNKTNDNHFLIKKHAKTLGFSEKEYVKTIINVYNKCIKEENKK